MNTKEAIERARSWAENPGTRPDPAKAKVVARVMVEHIDWLTKIASGELRHVYNGLCPDPVEGYKVRDTECPACQVLMAAEQAKPGIDINDITDAGQPIGN